MIFIVLDHLQYAHVYIKDFLQIHRHRRFPIEVSHTQHTTETYHPIRAYTNISNEIHHPIGLMQAFLVKQTTHELIQTFAVKHTIQLGLSKRFP